MTWNQELRNKLYGAAAGVITILLTLGVINQATGDDATTIVTAALDNVEGIIGLVAAVTAFVKSLPGRVTTLDVPKTAVDSVVTTSGALLAGPASPAADGTVLAENVSVTGDTI